ncbi:MAG: DNA-binding protein WhiA [Thermacetogeniaceae bacterium]
MSFAEQVKNEIAQIMPERRCCLVAELAALARVSGSLQFGTRPTALLVAAPKAVIARKIFKLTRRLGWQATVTLRHYNRPRRYRLFVVEIPVEQDGVSVLQELGLFDRRNRMKEHLDSRILDRVCCRRAFLRGCFLGSGFISDPEHSYQLEFRLSTEEAAHEVSTTLFRFGLTPGLREHNGRQVVYLKEAEQIGEFLKVVGAVRGVLDFENSRILKEMRNRVNRLVNCETANLKKAVDTGLKQAEMIREIDEKIGLASLPPRLRELAELRLRHPEASLVELGRLLAKPVGKSGINHRMRELRRIAEAIRNRED